MCKLPITNTINWFTNIYFKCKGRFWLILTIFSFFFILIYYSLSPDLLLSYASPLLFSPEKILMELDILKEDSHFYILIITMVSILHLTSFLFIMNIYNVFKYLK